MPVVPGAETFRKHQKPVVPGAETSRKYRKPVVPEAEKVRELKKPVVPGAQTFLKFQEREVGRAEHDQERVTRDIIHHVAIPRL